MADNDPENGDDDFEKFVSENTDACPNSIALIISALREKTKFMTTLYNTSLGAYLKLSESDPLRAELARSISKLLDYSFHCLDQYDFAVMDDDDDDETDSGDGIDPPDQSPF
jgi:hypothetical protein